MKILIVTDDEQSKNTILNVFKDMKPTAQVITLFGSVDAAVTSIIENKPDIVVMDTHLTDGTGFDILRRFKTITFKIIFIASTDKFALKALKFNATDYLLKPIDPAELKESLSKALLDFPVHRT